MYLQQIQIHFIIVPETQIFALSVNCSRNNKLHFMQQNFKRTKNKMIIEGIKCQ